MPARAHQRGRQETATAAPVRTTFGQGISGGCCNAHRAHHLDAGSITPGDLAMR
jgi:hypothetical protein